ncbi:alpha/beta fold hydrolase [Paenibacillus ehimensis]|uniref:Alpha/beta hydrolase n=1 Tax=Paenibacillus ehimensis TaxID=79264 RepID=A0ABT8V9Z0_9BACL|nr:alpha/beta hydrolase [Paenibacillus ehimensis]MDO3677800.1 alpha/beta hydrolase [Paenibacillus ehimensis]
MNRHVDVHRFEDLPLEYSVTGEGEPILVMHGGHSNCYEEFGYAALIRQGYCLITPSRAGYGGTSKALGASLTRACRAYNDLLDRLQLGKVHLLAVSAGGPSGIRFASLFPDRIRTFTLQCAVTKAWLTPQDKEYRVSRLLFRPPAEKAVWKLLGRLNNGFPRFVFRQMAPSFSTLTRSEIAANTGEGDWEAFRRMNNRQRSGHGFFIDLSQIGDIVPSELEHVRCPALVLHSRHDRLVPLEHAFHAHRHLPQSELRLLDTWGHLIWLGKGAEETDEAMLAFLRRNRI